MPAVESIEYFFENALAKIAIVSFAGTQMMSSSKDVGAESFTALPFAKI